LAAVGANRAGHLHFGSRHRDCVAKHFLADLLKNKIVITFNRNQQTSFIK